MAVSQCRTTSQDQNGCSTACLSKKCFNRLHRQKKPLYSFGKLNEAETGIESMRVVVLGVYQDRGRCNPCARLQCSLQRVYQKQFANTLTSKREVTRQPSDKGCPDNWIAGKFKLFHQLRRKVVGTDVIGRKGVIACNPAVLRNQHVRYGHTLLSILARLLLQIAIKELYAA